MNGPVVDRNFALVVEPNERVLHPILIVSVWKIFARMGASTF
jgi:hypothetical protein